MRSATRKLDDLVVDQNLFPRSRVDDDNVDRLRSAMRGGAELPPILIDQKNRIIDGRHRYLAYLAERGEQFCVEVKIKHYDDDRAAFIDAIRLNSKHGKPLTKFDRATILSRGLKNKATMRAIAAALGMKWAEFKGIAEGRVATVQHTYPPPVVRDTDTERQPIHQPERVIISKTIGHMAGRELTPVQVRANERLNGRSQIECVDQVITLLEFDLLDTENSALMRSVEKLHDLLSTRFASGAMNGKTLGALATAGA